MFRLIPFVVLFLLAGAWDEDNPEVRIKDGVIRGNIEYSKFTSRRYAVFEGIPYAKPPVGERRFEPPEESEPWPGVLISRKPNICLQYPQVRFNLLETIGDEDCLYINVYTPADLNEDALLDVIVHIHGGAFMWGHSFMYGPELLMEHDVVYVNFNYRLGPLGFLSTEDEILPGNNGMKDQVLALKWIKKNIRYFGGNPESVTITGLSAGGASVHYHYLSPMSRGLFKQGISISGCALNPWTLSYGNREKAKKLAHNVGCPTETTKEMVECLKKRPASSIAASVGLFMEIFYNPFSPFGIVVEKKGDEPFLTDHPYQLIKAGKVQDLPWLSSATKDEGLYPAAEFVRDTCTLPMLEMDWHRLAPHILDYNYTADVADHKLIANRAKNYYLRGNSIDKDNFNKLVQMIGDRHFTSGLVRANKMQSEILKSPNFFYYFKYRGKKSLSDILSESTTNYGVSHGDDIYYLLPGILQMDDEDAPMAHVMVNMWITFAKTGKPEVENVIWEPVCKENEKLVYLEIESPEKISLKHSDTLGHTKFWKTLPLNEKHA